MACSSDTCSEQVAIAHRCGGQCSERTLCCFGIALRTRLFESTHLLLADIGVIDIQHIDHFRIRDLVLVDTDDHVLASIHSRLLPGRGFFDAHLWPACSNGLGHTTRVFDLGYQLASLIGQVGREFLDVVATGQRINGPSYTSFFGQDQLGVTSESCAEFGR